MHEILDISDPNIVGFHLSGTLTEDDHDALASALKDAMESHTTTRTLFELEDVEGWEPEALWEDLSFDIRHVQTLDKVMVVGDLWDPWMDKMELIFPTSRIDTSGDREDALAWLRGEMEVPGIGPGSVPDPDADAQDE